MGIGETVMDTEHDYNLQFFCSKICDMPIEYLKVQNKQEQTFSDLLPQFC